MSVRTRQVKLTQKSNVFYPYVDSLIYLVTPMKITNKIQKYVMDYTYTINGYIVILYTLLQKNDKVYIENREVLTNLPGKIPLIERSKNMRLNNLMTLISTFNDLLIIMPKREKNEWIDQLLKSPTLTEESKTLMETGLRNNIYPSRFYVKNPTKDQYEKSRIGILKHLNITIFLAPPTCNIVEFELDPVDFPEMKNYNKINNTYGTAKRLYYLCKKLNLKLSV